MDPQLQRLIDIEDIRRVVYRYFYAADSGNMDFVLSCFTDDVVQDLNGGIMHIEGIKQVRSWIDKTFVIRTVQSHTVSNIDVDVNGDTAHSETRVLAFLVDPDLSTFGGNESSGVGGHKIMCRGQA